MIASNRINSNNNSNYSNISSKKRTQSKNLRKSCLYSIHHL